MLVFFVLALPRCISRINNGARQIQVRQRVSCQHHVLWLQACGHQRPADAVVRLNAQTLIDTFFLAHTLPLLRSHSFSRGDLSLAAIADVTGTLKKSGL